MLVRAAALLVALIAFLAPHAAEAQQTFSGPCHAIFFSC